MTAPGDGSSPKAALRRSLLARRRERGVGYVEPAYLAPLLTDEIRIVASYAAMADEPDLRDFHEVCSQRGRTLLFPRLLADDDLELAGGELTPGPRGTVQPTGPAVQWDVPQLIVVPALAVDHLGMRLGRGGGSYDRALRRRDPTTVVVAVLAFDDEVIESLPTEPHDQRVDLIVTPAGLRAPGL